MRPRVTVFLLALTLVSALAASRSSSARTLALNRRGTDTFTAEPVPAGMVSKARAIVTALHFAFGPATNTVPSGVHVETYFGLYTGTIYTQRPVWIVRFTGPGISVSGSGGPPPPAGKPFCDIPVAHEEMVVVDGRMGTYLEATVGINPSGLPTPVIAPEPSPTPCPAIPQHPLTPWTVAVSPQGNVFLGGEGIGFANTVQKWSPSGRLLFSFATNTRGQSNGIIRIALDGRGNVYIGNQDDLIQKFSPAGHLLWQWATAADRIHAPSGWWTLATARNGTVYATSRSTRSPIDVLSPSGKLLARWPGRWDFLTVDGAGTIYAANVQHGLISAFSPTGRGLRHWLIETSPGVGTILSIAAGPDGSISVLEQRSRLKVPFYEVARFSPGGRFLGRVRIAEGLGPHALIEPRDLAIGPHSSIFIVDPGNPRLFVLSPSGRFLRVQRL